jgi:CBS domain-containing protein
MEKLQAKDIMIQLDRYPHVTDKCSLKKAIVEMEKSQFEIHGRKSLPRVVLVFDEEYRLMGMVRRRDILRGLGPDAMQETRERTGERDPAVRRDLHSPGEAGRTSLAELNRRGERLVSEVMTPIRVTLEHDVPLLEVANFMAINDVSIVPILKNGEVIGMARSTDVLHLIGKAMISQRELTK